ncbi:hypothetical protein CERZMDRAFT_111747 [Cercospora zeae-maydis SCOH1-5]|uniref:PinX1-related protein 1 n=1 Tax=Cercospora zeae-maydis SCOH1-5 TaxID=717836 RepID=A0A6A6FGX1_9PEZI|nr:hypothetical protein CERZMDRAFT_111747 [Cercospora zeae-maydis SCOH1-5]
MGLAGNKKKTKLSSDPNNTAWAKSTTSFGHKILSKQGWKPGDYLGAENASHSEHFTAANASHIRVMLREDNLGLGAKIGTQNAETFGLSMFSGLLGRLNGKEEDQVALKKKEETIRDVQLKLKYGNLNFVRGGLLVGDKMCEVKTDLGHLKEGGRKRKASEAEEEDESEEDSKASKKRRKDEKKKKQKAASNGTAAAIKEMKWKRKLEAGGREDLSAASDVLEQEAKSSSSANSSSDEKTSHKPRNKKSSRKNADKESKRESEDSSMDKTEKSRLKEAKRLRKEERRRRKEEKRAKRAAKEEAKKGSSKSSTTTQPSSAIASESEAASGTSTPTFMGGRQAVRHRYIMQKRMAAGSAQALKEIFMMKPQVAS